MWSAYGSIARERRGVPLEESGKKGSREALENVSAKNGDTCRKRRSKESKRPAEVLRQKDSERPTEGLCREDSESPLGVLLRKDAEGLSNDYAEKC